MAHRISETEQFKRAVEDGFDVSGTVLRKQYAARIKGVDRDERTARFAISTASVDRHGDTVAVDGWVLDPFRSNPVVLWAHSHDDLPVAQALEVGTDDSALVSRALFTSREENPFGDMVFNLVAGGFLRATSVGFIPLEFEEADDDERAGRFFMPLDIKRQELLEFSVVPVPANRESLVQARAKGIDTAPLVAWAERVLDQTRGEKLVPARLAGVTVPRRDLERVRRAADASGGSAISLPREVQDELRRRNLERIGGETDREADVDPAELDGIADKVAGLLEGEIAGLLKGVISFDAAHPGGTPLADRDEAWDGPGEVAEAEVDDLRVMSAWVAQEDEGEQVKGDFKLPHHRASGEHAVVWRGVTAAAARLPQTDVPESDVLGIQDHIGRHYREFGEVAPWDREDGVWPEYVAAVRALLESEGRDVVDDTVAVVERGIYEFGDEPRDRLLTAYEATFGSVEPGTPDYAEQEFGPGDVVEAARKQDGFEVQTLIFPKRHWESAEDAQGWGREHGFEADEVDETLQSFRIRQRDPGDFERLYTICLTPGDAEPGDEECRVEAVGGPLEESVAEPPADAGVAHEAAAPLWMDEFRGLVERAEAAAAALADAGVPDEESGDGLDDGDDESGQEAADEVDVSAEDVRALVREVMVEEVGRAKGRVG